MLKSLFTFSLLISLPYLANAGGVSQLSAQENISKRNIAKRWDAEWKASLNGSSSTGERGESKLFGFNFDLQTSYKLNRQLSFQINPIFRYSNGATQSFDTSDKTENRITLNNAAIEFQPIRNIELNAGALNQEKIHSSLLVDSIPFPAARFTLKTEATDQLVVGLVAQNAIPTTSSLASNTGEKEKTPSLTTASLKGNYKSDSFGLRLHAGFFQWENIPTSVAQKSYGLGNSVEVISDSEGRWQYKYSGLDTKIESNIEFGATSVRFGVDYLKNNKAPARLNTAYQLWGILNYQFDPNLNAQLLVSRFRVESDATLAYFAPGRFFNTNRNGQSFEGKIAFPKDGYNLALRFTEADVISEHPIQLKERNLILKLETTYAEF